MCNASIQLANVVENQVLRSMQGKESFTALDISNALKIAKYPVRHREVAEVVRDIYNSGAMMYYDYDRQTVKVTTDGGAKTAEAYLYHHQSARVTDYSRLNQDALPPVPADQARDLTDCVAADPLGLLKRTQTGATARHRASSQGYSRRMSHGRRDGALPIPRRIIQQLGWTDGDALAVRAEQGKVIVEASGTQQAAQTTQAPPTVVKVWGGGRVRICKTKLLLGALAADAVTVSVDSNSLCIAALP